MSRTAELLKILQLKVVVEMIHKKSFDVPQVLDQFEALVVKRNIRIQGTDEPLTLT